MQITDKTAVSIHYILTNTNGEQLDSSHGQEPLSYLHGYGNIIPGLESALEGKAVNDSFTVTIPPAEAYGERKEEMTQVVPKSMFQGVDNVEVGMQFHADASHGVSVVTVSKVEGDEVTIDGNHPLAGEALTFAVDIVDVRAATDDELEHGHIHGTGCSH